MKRGISLLMVLLILLPLVSGPASAVGIFRHEVNGDVSQFVISEEAGNSTASVSGTEAKIGTDIYLFVDPDTATYVTFYVTDEYGKPLENAQIYLTYDGNTEFFGTTDENGRFSSYLFRNTEYGYTVKLYGYETAVGTFNATEALTEVHVVMRKYHDVDVYIVDNGIPVPGVTVIIEGTEYVTDKNGHIHLVKPNGIYNITILTPDGREINNCFQVDGDTTVIYDIGLDDTLAPGGTRGESFLVYNRDYIPEDYVLTLYNFAEEDLKQQSEETDEEFQERITRYLEQNPSTVVVEAQPDRKQNPTGPDTDLLDEEENPIYSQRSMMPSGYLLKAWEDQGYSQLVFTNEDMGVKFELEDLHSPEMTKVFALAWYLTDEKVWPSHICQNTITRRILNYRDTGLLNIDKSDVDLDAIDMTVLKDFEFQFVHEQEEEPDKEHDLLKNYLYTGATFEFRITPIEPEAMREMVRDGLNNKVSLEKNSIMVANREYFLEVLRRWKAEGKLDDNEAKELYAFCVDGKFTSQELKELKQDFDDGLLTDAAIDLLLEAAVEKNLYRVSCFLRYRDVVVNITNLLESMELIRNMDAYYEEAYQQVRQQEIQDEMELEEDERIAQAEEIVRNQFNFLLVDNDYELFDHPRYNPGAATKQKTGTLIRSFPEEDNEFYSVLERKQFRIFTADVRLESITLENMQQTYRAITFQKDFTKLQMQRALVMKSNLNALTGLAVLKEPDKTPWK